MSLAPSPVDAFVPVSAAQLQKPARSQLGVTSFTLAVFTLVAGFGLLLFALSFGGPAHGDPQAVKQKGALFGALGALLLPVLLAAFGFGIASLFARGKKRTLGFWGLGISSGILIPFVALGFYVVQLRKSQQHPLAAASVAPAAGVSSPLVAAAGNEHSDGQTIDRIAANDQFEVTISTDDGVALDEPAQVGLRDALVQQFNGMKEHNASEAAPKQFMILVEVTKFDQAKPGSPGMRDLELKMDVRLFPGNERVCYVGTNQIAGPEQSDADLEQMVAASAAQTLANRQMWTPPVKIDVAEAAPPSPSE